MSLADQIAQKNEQHATPDNSIDELGIPIPTPETPEYWVARALLINQPQTFNSIYGLHTRNGGVWFGHDVLKEDKETLYRLAQLRHSVQTWQSVEFWRILKKYIPTLSRHFLEIAPDLIWDVDRAEIIDRKTANARLRRSRGV